MAHINKNDVCSVVGLGDTSQQLQQQFIPFWLHHSTTYQHSHLRQIPVVEFIKSTYLARQNRTLCDTPKIIFHFWEKSRFYKTVFIDYFLK